MTRSPGWQASSDSGHTTPSACPVSISTIFFFYKGILFGSVSAWCRQPNFVIGLTSNYKSMLPKGKTNKRNGTQFRTVIILGDNHPCLATVSDVYTACLLQTWYRFQISRVAWRITISHFDVDWEKPWIHTYVSASCVEQQNVAQTEVLCQSLKQGIAG